MAINSLALAAGLPCASVVAGPLSMPYCVAGKRPRDQLRPAQLPPVFSGQEPDRVLNRVPIPFSTLWLNQRVTPMKLVPATHDQIAALAYRFYEEEGRPEGRHDIHWQRAYMELLAVPAEAPVKAGKAKAKAPKSVASDVAAVTDVSLIGGVGSKIKGQLAAEGIRTLADIAAMTPTALAGLDAKLGFKGRSAREDWIAQAKELVAGKAPRAKTDKARLSAKA
jgi:predicted flap endonuclease-1-like 5' DNA nuclease